jgi:hypothetical protein
MIIENRRDLSVSMLRANVAALVIAIPVAILQLTLFVFLHGSQQVIITTAVLLNVLLFFVVLLVSAIAHEFIHGLTWKILGKNSSVVVSYGIQWKTLTPFAHLEGPIEVNIYRLGGFMPGFVLGILPYFFGLLLGNSVLFWFGVFHTMAASGDWLILWLLRDVKGGRLVVDHPSRAGCYVLNP